MHCNPARYLVSQTAALTGAGAMALVSTASHVDRRPNEGNRPHLRQARPSRRRQGRHLPRALWPGNGRVHQSCQRFAILGAAGRKYAGNWVKVVQRIPVRIAIARSPGATVSALRHERLRHDRYRPSPLVERSAPAAEMDRDDLRAEPTESSNDGEQHDHHVVARWPRC